MVPPRTRSSVWWALAPLPHLYKVGKSHIRLPVWMAALAADCPLPMHRLSAMVKVQRH